MRILYLLPSLQHPTIQRGGLRHYHFLRELARRHEITLLALERADTTEAARAEIGALVERCVLVPVGGASSGALTRSRVARGLDRELRVRRALHALRREFLMLAREEHFDVLLFHGKVVYPVIRGFRGLPIVVDFCDATSMRLRDQLRHAEPLESPWRLWRYLAMRRLERSLMATTPHVAFISPRDRAAVPGAERTATVIPNGIDLAYWTRRGQASGRQNRLVFTGVMSYAPNADAALLLIERILPVLRASRPDVELVIVGRDPPAAVVEAGRRAPGVTVTGQVDDVRPYLEEGGVYVAPLRYASGLQNKVLEALAMEIPVVTTPVVVGGLHGGRGLEPPVRVADGVDEIASAILTLVECDVERHRLAAAGRRFVEAAFEWTREAARLEAMCLEAAASRVVTTTATGPRALDPAATRQEVV